MPNYQRSYAWQKKQLKDFLDDFSHIENYKKYYYGTILLQQKENLDDTYEIVDGQQRLTTLIIFMNCLIQRMAQLGLNDEASELSKKFIKYRTKYILKLQDQDDGFFKTYILSDNQNITTNTPAQNKIWEAKNFFTEALKTATMNDCQDYKARIQAANCLVYSVNDRNEAAMIFETTNDRGKVLTNLEKTKSFLMYKASITFKNANSLLDTIQQGFNEIYTTYEALKGKPKFALDENSIQQYMFIAYENWKNKKIDGKSYKAYQHYMDELKSKINILAKEVYDATEDKEKYEIKLNQYIENYIKNLKESFNAIKCMYEHNGMFKKLLALDRMASIFPILIKAYWFDKTEKKTQFCELCRWCEIFCFRGLIILKNLSNKYQDQWYNLAKTFNGNFEKLFFEIKKIIISLGDEEKFLSALKAKEFYKEYAPKDRNYFFWSYENHLRNKYGYAPLTFEDLWQNDYKKRLTIEHIVAQKDEKEKCRILKDGKIITIGHRSVFDKEYLHSIGNLTIDPQSANASKGADSVDKKNITHFVRAPLISQNELDDFMKNGKWTVESINSRKDKILDFAKKNWCFEFNSEVKSMVDEPDNEEIPAED